MKPVSMSAQVDLENSSTLGTSAKGSIEIRTPEDLKDNPIVQRFARGRRIMGVNVMKPPRVLGD